MTASSELSVIIVGAGGLGREIAQYVRELSLAGSPIHLKGFLDDDAAVAAELNGAGPLLGDIDSFVPEANDRLVVAIGDAGLRADVTAVLRANRGQFTTVVHPTAYVASSARLGDGCIVSPFCSVGNQARLGSHVMLLPYAGVGHDTYVESFAVLSPHCIVNGGAQLGEGAFLGTLASVNPGQRVGAWAKVAAGSVVYESVPDGCLAVGNPALSHPMEFHRERSVAPRR